MDEEAAEIARIGEIEDLKDEIALKEAILESLNDAGLSEDDGERRATRKELKKLEKRLRGLQHPGKTEKDEDETQPELNQIPQHDEGELSRNPNDYLRSPQFKLTSRKRPRSAFDDEQRTPSKSRHSTPTPGPSYAASPAPSSATNDSFDDDSFGSFFGLTKEEVDDNAKYWRAREDRVKQEQLDAEMAQSMSQEWNAEAEEVPRPSTSNNADMSQSFLRADGALNRFQASYNRMKLDPAPSASSLGRIKPEPSSSSLRHIKPEPTEAMPGAFPATSMSAISAYAATPPTSMSTIPAYASNPGQSVYGSASNAIDVDSPAAYDRPDVDHSDPAQHEAELQRLLQHIRPDEDLTLQQMPPQPHGMKIDLMPHQLSGLAWMKKMEDSDSTKGGILADDMGLGKTIQAIALMLEHPPIVPRPTLVVAPVALLQQWKREIQKMVRPSQRLEVFIMHGEHRKVTWPALKAYDVVLTSYGVLAAELKRKLVLDERKNAVGYQPSAAEDCPILGDRSRFHRVILDEAQNVKNRNTKGSHAVCRIEADYRWCLTGTPMQNNVEELYSLIKFLRIRPYHQWERFRRDIAGPLKQRHDMRKDAGMQSLQALLRIVLLRRNKNSTIHGQPILQLPPKEVIEDRVAFEEDQKTFYFALETSAQIQMNRYIKAGTVGRHYANALVLLLRLRQAACHPGLVVASKDFVQLPGGELNEDALIRNAKNLNAAVITRLKEIEGGTECPICIDITENPTVFFCGHYSCGDCLDRLAENARNDGGHPKCPVCRGLVDVNNVTDYASFLKVHCPDKNGEDVEIPQWNTAGSDDDSDVDSDSGDDSVDSDEGDDLGGFIVYGSDDEDQKPSANRAGKKKVPRRKSESKGKSKFRSAEPPKTLAELRKESLKNKAARKKYLKRLRKNFEPSAKTNRTMELLQEIRDRGEGEKTIIFSNFTSFLDIVETQMYDHPDFKNYVRYDGSMSSQARNDAVLEFTENPRCTIMLISLKAGNAGLNLTVANHVIMLDPFWNPFVEYQAADRCYRIGQQRNVVVHRVFIGQESSVKPIIHRTPGEDEEVDTGGEQGFSLPSEGYTVEDRIMALQEKKRALVETALDENAGRAVSRLGIRELGYLFGLNRL